MREQKYNLFYCLQKGFCFCLIVRQALATRELAAVSEPVEDTLWWALDGLTPLTNLVASAGCALGLVLLASVLRQGYCQR